MAPYAMSKVSAATTGNDAMISITATLLMGTICTCAMTQTGLNMVVALYSVELSDEGFTCLAFDPGHVQTDMGGGHVSPCPPITWLCLLVYETLMFTLSTSSCPSDHGNILDHCRPP